MNASEILNKVLLQNKQITLSFSSAKALQSFRSSLHTYLTRYRVVMRKLGDDSLDDIAINVRGSHEEATFSISSKAATRKHTYQILNIETPCENMNPSGEH